jgi:HEAT repeat protein
MARDWLALGTVLFMALGGLAPLQAPDAGAPAWAADAGTLTGAALKAEVDALLSGATAAEGWQRLGPEAVTVLEAIFRDPGGPPVRRQKALAALAQLAVPEAADRLRAVVNDAAGVLVDRCTAAVALGRRARGETAEAAAVAVADLQPLLQAPADPLRIAAAQGLGAAGGEEARTALEEQLEREEAPEVREAIQRTLTAMQP